MIDRDYRSGPIVLRCDGCSSEYCETGERDFAAALASAKSEGWAVIPIGEGSARDWCHFGPDCVERRPWADPVPDLRKNWGRNAGGRA